VPPAAVEVAEKAVLAAANCATLKPVPGPASATLTPTEAEFRAALRKIGDGKSAADAQVPAEHYKALEGEEATRSYLRTINDYWCSGSWDTLQMVTGHAEHARTRI
jgi:hypothetical protein